MNMAEKLCLQWNDFKENVSSSFGELREDADLTDVTLVCEDGKQVEAHKVILASSSPFFMHFFKKNKHSHPLIYMRGLQLEDLLAILDFLYFGEANIFQDNLDSFLALAEELKLKGLTATENTRGNQQQTIESSPSNEMFLEKSEKKTKQSINSVNMEYGNSANFDKAVAVQNNSVNIELQDLDQQIKSMMTMTIVRPPDGNGFLATCNVCGKESPSRAMPQHIESNHITGFSHACNICGKTSRSRNALATHKHSYHKTLLQDQK